MLSWGGAGLGFGLGVGDGVWTAGGWLSQGIGPMDGNGLAVGVLVGGVSLFPPGRTKCPPPAEGQVAGSPGSKFGSSSLEGQVEGLVMSNSLGS